KGLEGVVVSATSLSNVDGENGRLIYQGYDIADLASNATYEEVCHLLFVGKLPNKSELKSFTDQMDEQRALPDQVVALIKDLPKDVVPMDVLRTGASAYGAVKLINGL